MLTRESSKFVWGYICLTAVVLQWVTSGFVSQYVYTNFEYRSSITQSIYTLTIYAVLFIPHLWNRFIRSSGDTGKEESASQMQFIFDNKLKVFALGCLWMCAQVIYTMSLLFTSMGTNTALSSSSSAFSFIFSMIFLGYKFRLLSGLGVSLTVAGVVLTALFRAESSSPDPNNETSTIKETVEGIILALSAAACFGLFSCLFKKWVVNDKHGGVVFASFGIVAFFIGCPLIVIANYSGLQQFVLPDYRVWLIVTADATMCCFVNNVCLSRAFIYLTPVIVLVGLCMTTPLSIFVDSVIFRNHTYSSLNIVGITMTTISVLIVGWDQATFEKSLEQQVGEKENVPNDDQVKQSLEEKTLERA